MLYDSEYLTHDIIADLICAGLQEERVPVEPLPCRLFAERDERDMMNSMQLLNS